MRTYTMNKSNIAEKAMNKPTITVKSYDAYGNYLITTANAIGVVKSLLINLSPSFYPNGERAYPSIRVGANSFNEQIEAVAGWCIQELKTCIKGGRYEKRLNKALNECIAVMNKQYKNKGVVGFNVSRRRDA